MATGGDIIEVTWNHPTLGSGTLYAKSAEDQEWDLGGFRTSDDANMIDGAGKSIRQVNAVRWKAALTISWDMNLANELDSLVALSGDPQEADWTLSHVNGTIWAGTGSPVGDLIGNGNQATMPLTISGGGKLEKISG